MDYEVEKHEKIYNFKDIHEMKKSRHNKVFLLAFIIFFTTGCGSDIVYNVEPDTSIEPVPQTTITETHNEVSDASAISIGNTPFITTWKTDNEGISEDNQIFIDTEGTGYSYHVEWGDGKSDYNVTSDITHTYTMAGTYTIEITGDFPHMIFGDVYEESIFTTFLPFTSDNHKILSVEQWGNIKWLSMWKAFNDCKYLVSNAIDAPDLSLVNDFSNMFSGAEAFNQPINHWDVSNVTDMNDMFSNAYTFNQDLSSWNVSNVNSMANMFGGADKFNQDISGWDVAKVVDMNGMFKYTSAFNQDIGGWDVANVKFMYQMFSNAKEFNQDIGNWDVSNVDNMLWMFSSAEVFNQDISRWDVSNVKSMAYMFSEATSFDQNLSEWDVSNVVKMDLMFEKIRLSTDNYDALLHGWGRLELQQRVYFDAGSSQYSASSQSARDALINNYNWTINDGGMQVEM